MFEIEKLQQSSPDLSVPPQKSPKTNTLADGSIERTSSMLDETESQIVFKDKVIDRGQKK